MKKRIGLKGIAGVFISSVLVSTGLLMAACSKSEPRTIKVGTIAGPETELMEIAREVAKNCYNLNVKIITFNDYNMPNTALSEGSLDANMFQHMPFLQAQAQARGYKIVAAAKTFIFPMGIYSRRYDQLDSLPLHAKIAIPNDPTNEARALLLLQEAGLITLNSGQSVMATVKDVSSNPREFSLVPLAAAQLPRALTDVDAAVINTNYAIPAGLKLRDALYSEGRFSQYANVLAVRAGHENDPAIQELISALHSEGVVAAARRIFGDSAVAAWDSRQPVLPCQSS